MQKYMLEIVSESDRWQPAAWSYEDFRRACNAALLLARDAIGNYYDTTGWGVDWREGVDTARYYVVDASNQPVGYTVAVRPYTSGGRCEICCGTGELLCEHCHGSGCRFCNDGLDLCDACGGTGEFDLEETT